MILFHSEDISGDHLTLTQEDSLHCARVLRHRCGDGINVVDGHGTMYDCVISSDNPRQVAASIIETHHDWNTHPYHLTAAVCPTKNNERFEWFVEKAVEMGVDTIVPMIGQRSERKIYKTDRARKLVVSAAKQSLKALFPVVQEPLSVVDFIRTSGADGTLAGTLACDRVSSGAEREGDGVLKVIAYCFEDSSEPRISLRQALADSSADNIVVMIGPEGDFSPEEAALAQAAGFIPVHLGPSRLRTETAALAAVSMIYTHFCL